VGGLRLVSRAKARAALAVALLLISTPALASSPSVGGRAYYVENAATGEVLLQRNAGQRVPIASITKLMTVLVALEHARLDDVVVVTKHAAAVGESSIYLRPGDRLTVRELVEAALIQSANDAAVALADYTSHGRRGQFVAWMNAKAGAFGLEDTHFVNPDGFDARGHYSSARDVTRLGEIAMRNPFVRSAVRRTDATISGRRRLHTWNDLLYTFPGLIGVKTGHTGAAGWSEVAAATGSQGVTVYATLLGGRTRAQRNADLTRLLAFGLSRYRIVRVVQPQRVYATAAVPYGKTPLVLVAARSAIRVVRIDRTLRERVVSARVVSLPVVRGQRLGEVRVYSRGDVIARVPLVASRSISRPGVIGRVGWYAGRTAHHAWSWIS
jgi:D-alanyl-D-alanine carboxypeptidase (penicillin-binding protein 5/6)